MLDADKVSISPVPTRKCDRSVRNRHHRTAHRHGVVRGQVCALSAEDRMHSAIRKAGADAWRKLQRRRQYGALQGNALFIVIRILESKAAVMSTGVDQFSRLDLPVLYEGAVVQKFVDDQPDLIARLNLGAEIDLPLENFGKFDSQILALGDIVEGFPKRSVDLGRHRFLAYFEIEFLDFRFVGVRALLDFENTFVINLVFERLQRSVGLLFKSESIAETHFAQIEDGMDEIGDFVGNRDGNVIVHQGGNQSPILLNPVFDDLCFWYLDWWRSKDWNGTDVGFPIFRSHDNQNGQQKTPNKPDSTLIKWHKA